jgi:PAS domain S-box-containing protein
MKYKLHDLVDLKHFQNLQDRLNEIYSFPSAIIDNDGNILTATAWQDLCTQFHRKHPDCERECRISDQYILSHLHEANPAVSYRCPHGLVDNATPIIIDGIHYGNFFTGQFFLEKPNLQFFQAQAKKYGFDETAYLQAVEKVPIWSKEQLNSYLFFIKGLIAIISESGLKRLKEVEISKQIEDSEERQRNLFERAKDGIFVMSATGKLISVNESFARMHGYSTEEMLKLNLRDFDTPESAQFIPERMRRLLAGEALTFEAEHFHKDGHRFSLEVSASAITSGGDTLIQCFHRDITERKRLEDAMETSERRFRDIANHAAEWIWEVDAQGRYTYASQGAEKILGYTPEEVLQKYFHDLFHPDDRELNKTAALAAFARKQPFREFINRNVHKNGQTVWLATSGIPMLDAQGNLLGYRGVDMDITERKQAEEMLQASEAEFRAMFEVASIGMAQADPRTGQWLRVNQKMCDITGYSAEEMLKLRVSELTHPEDRQRDWELFQQVIRGEKPDYHIEKRYLRKDGRVTWVNVNMTVIRDATGQPRRTTATIEDITERRALEEQLRQSQKVEAIGQLAGGIAHDFNNILGSFMMHLDLLHSDLNVTPEIQQAVRDLNKEAKRAAGIVRQLLLFSRKQVMQIQALDLNESVSEMLRMLRRLLGEHIKLTYEPAVQPVLVEADPGMVEQVIMNLCVNARDAMPNGGPLKLSIGTLHLGNADTIPHPNARPGAFACLIVQDAGCGMNATTLTHIFEPFFTTKEPGKGTGLGLATVNSVVKQHKGWVDVTSTVGLGTTFKVYLPLTITPTHIAATNNDLATYARGSETVLLVEDDANLRHVFRLVLSRLGYKVLEAENGVVALQLWHQHKDCIRLLLTDNIMPEGITGMQLAVQLRTEQPGLAVIICSGYNMDLAGRAIVAQDGLRHLPKPCDPATLAKVVREVLDTHV